MAEAHDCCENPFGTCPRLQFGCKLQRGGTPDQPSGYLVDFDHRKPWKDGGKSTYDNVQVLCPCCHANKTRNFDRPNNHRNQWVDSQGRWHSLARSGPMPGS